MYNFVVIFPQAFRIALMDLFGISHDEAGKILQTDPQKAQEVTMSFALVITFRIFKFATSVFSVERVGSQTLPLDCN